MMYSKKVSSPTLHNSYGYMVSIKEHDLQLSWKVFVLEVGVGENIIRSDIYLT